MRRAHPAVSIVLACAVTHAGCALSQLPTPMSEAAIAASGCVPPGLDAAAVVVGLEALRDGDDLPEELRVELIAVAACLGDRARNEVDDR